MILGPVKMVLRVTLSMMTTGVSALEVILARTVKLHVSDIAVRCPLNVLQPELLSIYKVNHSLVLECWVTKLNNILFIFILFVETRPSPFFFLQVDFWLIHHKVVNEISFYEYNIIF